MNDPAKALYRSSSTEELWIAFDFHGPVVKNRFHRELGIWGAAATVESLGYGRAVLVVQPGGALELVQ
jgi:hypothetical protein